MDDSIMRSTKTKGPEEAKVSLSLDKFNALMDRVDELEKAAAKDKGDARVDALLAKIATLEDEVAKQRPKAKPLPNQPPKLPVFNSAPVASGFRRVRIKTVQGRPVTTKVCMYDDTGPDVPEKYKRRVGYLHMHEVVDVPEGIFRGMTSRDGHSLIDLDLIEETSKPATRPFAYASEIQAKMADPRLRGRTREQIEQDMARVVRALKKNQPPVTS